MFNGRFLGRRLPGWAKREGLGIPLGAVFLTDNGALCIKTISIKVF